MTKYFLIIILPTLLVLATLIWLIVAAIVRSWRIKVPATLFAIEMAILAAFYVHWFTPKDYPRNYLENAAAAELTLGDLARSKNFHIGAAVAKAPDPTLSQLVPSQYSSITPENATKWRRLLVNGEIGNYDFSEADAIVDFARSQGVRVRGHTLVWGKFSGKTYPKALDDIIQNAADPQAELRRIMSEHIETTMTHFKGRIETWDVVNEPLSMDGPYLDKNIYLNTLGKAYIAEAFRLAHEVDPTATLFINEQFGNYTGEGVEVFFELLEWLIEEEVPIHGVGIQAHNIFKTHNLTEFRVFVDRIADLGLKFEVTEFDARIRLFDKADDPYQAQSDYMAEYARICIEHPACTGFTFWGLSDAGTWFDYVPPFSWMRPNDPLLFDIEQRPKPAYGAIANALKSRVAP